VEHLDHVFMQKWAIFDCFWSIKMQRVGLSKILKKASNRTAKYIKDGF